MPLYKFQVNQWADSELPRDIIVNSFYLNDRGATSDPQGLANDALAMWRTYWATDATRKLQVKVYNVGGPPPHFPIAEAQSGTLAPTSSVPREVALCLSYFSVRNLPRQRGRMYLSPAVSGHPTALRPSTTMRQAAIALGQQIAGLGGLDVDWVVYSPTALASYPVTSVWCDDEWDAQRRRGLRATGRLSATLGEGPEGI